MKTARTLIISLGMAAIAGAAVATEQGALDPNLEPLRPWLGKTWKSDASAAKDGKPKVDVARWERALNGKAVRILHSIDGGEYGGETIVRSDEKAKAVVYHYFTTAGFSTTGTMKFEDGKMITNETVSGNSGGITEVRGTAELRPDGTFRMKTEYLKDGQWQPGRDTVYREDSAAQVVFK